MALHAYEPVLSAKAWEFFGSLSRNRQQRLSRLVYQLAEYPHRLGEYQTIDSTGRPLENLRIEGCVFTYWADAGAKELRILDITPL
jgi:hypothetical protein